jgi:hypothetical protein
MKSPDALPLIYVETNWLVALLLPHDRHRNGAIELFQAAMNEECEIRIPYGSFLEAKARAEQDMNDKLAKDVAGISDLMKRAFENGFDDLEPARKALDSAEVAAYFQRAIAPLVDALDRNPKLVKLHDARGEFEMMTLLRPRLRFDGKNKFDLYLLASVLMDRKNTDPQRPAVFCTVNTKDFEPSRSPKAKITPGIYREFNIYWSGDFDWRKAVDGWKSVAVREIMES